MKNSVVFLALAGLVLLVLTSCGQAAVRVSVTPATTSVPAGTTAPATSDKPSSPFGTLNVGYADFGMEQFDQTQIGAMLGLCLYDTLISVDEKGSYIGNVASSWDIGEDGTTWTFHIRDDIRFHDGTSLTANDVKFSVDRFASENSTNPWSPYLTGNYIQTKVVDELTFQYIAERPEPTLVIPFSVVFIIPADYFTRVGPDGFNEHPIGSGPWQFISHAQQVSIILKAWTGHWREIPSFETLSVYQVLDEATRLAMFKRGELDVITNISTDRIVEMRDAGTRVISIGLPATYTIVWPGTWINNGPTHDKRVRQAMSYALNRQEMCDTYFGGTAVPGGRWFIAPGGFGWDDSWMPDTYDPGLAKQLLSEAGYPDAFDTPTIEFFISAVQAEFAQVLQGYWLEIGLDVKITILKSSALSGIVFVRNEDPAAPQAGCMWLWGPFSVVQNAIYHSANMYTSNGVHTTGNDTHADELYAKATSELDPALQRQYWTDFLNYAYDMWVNSGTVLIQPLFLVSDKIGDVGRNWILLDDSYATITHGD